MKIQKISLSNIGCYNEKSIDFDNLTVVYGENRSGKSTLVYSLFFALFGDHLNDHLSVSDLTRIGEPYGITRLVLEQSDVRYQLKRTTGGMPDVLEWSGESDHWKPLSEHGSEDLHWLIPTSAKMASLTSFFREGELIYFLRDMPKYNNTLLQNLVQMGNIFVVQSRFKKAVRMARDEKNRYQRQVPEEPVGEKDIQDAVAFADGLEREMAEVEKGLQTIRLNFSPETLKGLEKRRNEAKSVLDSSIEEIKKTSGPESVKNEVKALREELKNLGPRVARKGELEQQMGKNIKALEDLEEALRMLEEQKESSRCSLCGNIISPEQLHALLDVKREKRKHILEDLEKTKAALSEMSRLLDSQKNIEISMLKKERQLHDLMDMEKRRHREQEELKEAEKALSEYRAKYPELVEVTETYGQKKQLETHRAGLQKRLIEARVAVERLKGDHQRFEKNHKLLLKAERNVLVCETASKSLENAVKSLNSTLIEKVRKNLLEWSGHFGFLKEFDINMNVSRLTPIIQAKGYQYKLNQMSKSERIFLYLMLKLSIGDALSHLGVFILDDPADGLDRKRKALLSRLLAEVSNRRQLIVTTNDPDFADMFQGSHRIDLSP